MTYGLIADLHLHQWSAFSTQDTDGVNSRFKMLLSEIERCAREVQAAGGDTVVFAGDVFHVRGSVAPTVLNATIDLLRRLHRDLGINFIVLAGNHDLEGKSATRLGSAITALEGEGVTVINESTVGVPGLDNAVFVPWIDNIEALKKEVKDLSDSVTDASDMDLILHAPIDGVIDGLPDHGLTPEYLACLGFKRVFSGHYHNHRQMYPASAAAGEVVSIGALAHHSWCDIGSRAGYLIVHPNEYSWRKSHLPEFIDLGKAAEFCEPEELPLVVEGNYIRVRVDADKSKDVEAARKELLDMGARAVLVQAMPTAAVREGAVTAAVATGASLEVSVKEFIKGVAGSRIDDVTTEAFDVLSVVSELEA